MKLRKPEADTVVSDPQLEDQITALREQLSEFRRLNAFTVEDMVDNADKWIARAHGATPLYPAAFASGGRSLVADAVLEVVGAYVISQPAFRDWLHEQLAEAVGKSPGISTLDREQRDQKLRELADQVLALENELTRRSLQRDHDLAEEALAALSGDAA